MRTINLSSTKREHGDSRSLPHHAKAYSVRGNWRIPAHCAPSVLGPADVFILCCLQASARRLLNSTMPYVDKGTISSLLSSSCCSDFFPEGNLQERRSLFRISLVSDIFWAILNYITLLYVVCCFPLSFLLPGGICAFLIVFFFCSFLTLFSYEQTQKYTTSKGTSGFGSRYDGPPGNRRPVNSLRGP